MTKKIAFYRQNKRLVIKEGVIDWVHGGLDILGLIPGIGEAFDLGNAILYAKEGDWLNASLSLVSMIPEIGDAFGKGGKIAIYLEKMITKGGKAGKLAEKIMLNAPKVMEFVTKATNLYKRNRTLIRKFLSELKDVGNEKIQKYIVPHLDKVEDVIAKVEQALGFVESNKPRERSERNVSQTVDAVDSGTRSAVGNFTQSEVGEILADTRQDILHEFALRSVIRREVKKSFKTKLLA